MVFVSNSEATLSGVMFAEGCIIVLCYMLLIYFVIILLTAIPYLLRRKKLIRRDCVATKNEDGKMFLTYTEDGKEVTVKSSLKRFAYCGQHVVIDFTEDGSQYMPTTFLSIVKNAFLYTGIALFFTIMVGSKSLEIIVIKLAIFLIVIGVYALLSSIHDSISYIRVLAKPSCVELPGTNEDGDVEYVVSYEAEINGEKYNLIKDERYIMKFDFGGQMVTLKVNKDNYGIFMKATDGMVSYVFSLGFVLLGSIVLFLAYIFF